MSNTSMEDLLAQIQAMFKKHCLEIKEIINASIARIDSIMSNMAEEETSAKEAKESSYEEAENIKGKESGGKKEKNKQPKVRPTRNTLVSISIRLSKGPYKTAYLQEELVKQYRDYYYYLVSTKGTQQRTWDPRIQDHSKQHLEDKACSLSIVISIGHIKLLLMGSLSTKEDDSSTSFLLALHVMTIGFHYRHAQRLMKKGECGSEN
ncbi:hypothetical protein Tco_0344673 [Tanacetum coccineum]